MCAKHASCILVLKDFAHKSIFQRKKAASCLIFRTWQFGLTLTSSLIETKYWLNRVRERGLMKPDEVTAYVENLTQLARQLNTFASGLKTVRADQPAKKSVRESAPQYVTSADSENLFTEEDLQFLGNW